MSVRTRRARLADHLNLRTKTPSTSLRIEGETKSAITWRRPRARTSSATPPKFRAEDRKSTRLNSSHDQISYAVFCLKKKIKQTTVSNSQINRLNSPAFLLDSLQSVTRHSTRH